MSCMWANRPDILSSAAPSNSHPYLPFVVRELSAASQQQQQQRRRPCDVLFNQRLAADSGLRSVAVSSPSYVSVLYESSRN